MLNEYTIVLKKDADFWRDELIFTDKQTESLIPLLSAELTIHPDDDSTDVVWNDTNGKLLLPSEGVIQFSVDLEEIAEYEWETGTYCLSVTFMSGKRDHSFLTGPVQIAEAC